MVTSFAGWAASTPIAITTGLRPSICSRNAQLKELPLIYLQRILIMVVSGSTLKDSHWQEITPALPYKFQFVTSMTTTLLLLMLTHPQLKPNLQPKRKILSISISLSFWFTFSMVYYLLLSNGPCVKVKVVYVWTDCFLLWFVRGSPMICQWKKISQRSSSDEPLVTSLLTLVVTIMGFIPRR